MPDGLARLVQALLAKNPADRPQTARAVAALLAEADAAGGTVQIPAAESVWAVMITSLR